MDGLAYFTPVLQARRFCLLRGVRPGGTFVLGAEEGPVVPGLFYFP